MKFAAVHKATCYLMLLVSVAPVALAGDLPAPAVAVFFALVVGSWFVEAAPASPRAEHLWTAALVVFAVALGADMLRGGAILTDSEYFVLGLMVQQLFNRRASRNYLWLYVLCFGMLVVGTTVSTGVSFLLLFLGFIVLLVWNLVFHHLRREMEDNYLLRHADATQSERVEVARVLNSRRIVGPQFLAGTAAASLGVFAGALLVFFLFPRVGFGFVFGGARARTSMAGFSETVRLGHHGTIKDNPEVVMRVAMSAPPAHPLRWRGAAFALYRGGMWMHADNRRFAMAEYAEPGDRTVVFALPLLPRAGGAGLRGALGRAASWDVFLEPLDSPVVFAADRPLAFAVQASHLGSAGARLYTNREMEVRTDRARSTTLGYRAYSDLSSPPEVEMAAMEDPPASVVPERYLDLPPDLPAAVADLARRVTAGLRGPYAKARAVRDHLVANYRYTRDLVHDEKLDPIYEFLFVRRAGHCEYFASAMALLLRAVGVPTRVVNGFYGGAWNDLGKFLSVRQGDAHSWVEVHFSGVGWIAFEPTPPSGQMAQAEAGWLRMALDAARLTWTRWVIEYDLAKQVDAVKRVARWMGGKPLPPGLAGAREAALRLVRPMLVVAAGLIVLAALVRLRPRWARPKAGAAARERPRDPATRLYRRLLARLERQGLRKRDGDTPGEFARALREGGHPAAPLCERVTHAYYEVRFGGAAPDEALLQTLASEVARIRAQERLATPPTVV